MIPWQLICNRRVGRLAFKDVRTHLTSTWGYGLNGSKKWCQSSTARFRSLDLLCILNDSIFLFVCVYLCIFVFVHNLMMISVVHNWMMISGWHHQVPHLQLRPHVNSGAVLTCTLHGVMETAPIQMSFAMGTPCYCGVATRKALTRNVQYLGRQVQVWQSQNPFPPNTLWWCERHNTQITLSFSFLYTTGVHSFASKI